MKVTCIDASDNQGTGTGLLTVGKEYDAMGAEGGYYLILCDNGEYRAKCKGRFETVRTQQ